MEIEFIDEDNLLLTCISVLEHPETEEEIDFDYLAESSCSRQNHIMMLREMIRTINMVFRQIIRLTWFLDKTQKTKIK